ncbi:MAG: signal recognition particle protein, partial [Gemmatimonadetes bacterium]|nr:signal recognition particle protein [Gemmatimonadota bacterium]
DAAFKKLRGRGKLNEKDVTAGLREIRLALLEADVHFKVVKEFLANVKERAVGQEVLDSISPGQQLVKIVNDELVKLLGGQRAPIKLASQPPTVVLLAGLQGSGKTTFAAKLARRYIKRDKRVHLVAGDIYRPAAADQLEQLAKQIGASITRGEEGELPDSIAERAIKKAAGDLQDLVIVDTAGRLHVDEDLMDEIERVHAVAKPNETLLVVDGMTGQDAVNVATSFQERIAVDGFVLTKMDGDARGGAALSIRHVTGKPIKFVGTGEGVDALEDFYPDRMANRILGMGDVVGLVEKAAQSVDMEKAAHLADRMRRQQFTLDDFADQLKQLKKMGPLDQIMGMIPGAAKMPKGMKVDDKAMGRTEAIISSMTPLERAEPVILNGSRRKRIARGSGTSVQEVNQLLKQFDMIRKMMKKMGGKRGKKGRMVPRFQ